jgi:hypothetical protein
MRIVLPWPDRRLSPNARLHFRVTAPVKAKARKDAAYITFDAMPYGLREVRQHFAGDGPINYEVTFYPPDSRHRDDDNMIGAFKAARDGIADALGVNDKRFKPVYFFEEPCKPGRIEVRLSTCGYAPSTYADSPDSAKENADRESVGALNPGPAKIAIEERN